uniref:SXP/RAL-2 family protein Ani s 5-like cation-binding domain-containing protein n=1 Tax=Caenorhabditis japonica TaxID=281687 RepID=A0A8R1I0U2_CAEJA
MCKLFVAVALLAITASAQPTPPTADQVKAELVAAGVSETAAAGLIAVGEKYKDQFIAAKGDKEAGKNVFDQLRTDAEAYIKTQPESDQTAFVAFIQNKKAEFEANHGGPAPLSGV